VAFHLLTYDHLLRHNASVEMEHFLCPVQESDNENISITTTCFSVVLYGEIYPKSITRREGRSDQRATTSTKQTCLVPGPPAGGSSLGLLRELVK